MMDGQQKMLKLCADNWATVQKVHSYCKVIIIVTHPLLKPFLLKNLLLGATSNSSAYLGQGRGPILLENVRCSGSESQLKRCLHSILTSNDYHSVDDGVQCLPGLFYSTKIIFN